MYNTINDDLERKRQERLQAIMRAAQEATDNISQIILESGIPDFQIYGGFTEGRQDVNDSENFDTDIFCTDIIDLTDDLLSYNHSNKAQYNNSMALEGNFNENSLSNIQSPNTSTFMTSTIQFNQKQQENGCDNIVDHLPMNTHYNQTETSDNNSVNYVSDNTPKIIKITAQFIPFTAEKQFAKRSKPMTRRVAENHGWGRQYNKTSNLTVRLDIISEINEDAIVVNGQSLRLILCNGLDNTEASLTAIEEMKRNKRSELKIEPRSEIDDFIQNGIDEPQQEMNLETGSENMQMKINENFNEALKFRPPPYILFPLLKETKIFLRDCRKQRPKKKQVRKN